MTATPILSNGAANKITAVDSPAHDWYRFVLSYPPHLVRDYVQRFSLDETSLVLDPFCGTGTTIVECAKLNIPSIGIEANPLAHFASQVKVDWAIDPDKLLAHAERIADAAATKLLAQGIVDDDLLAGFQPWSETLRPEEFAYQTLPPESFDLLLTDSISPLPLHKVLVLLETIRMGGDESYQKHELLALAKAIVFTISNLRFGPEVGLGKIKVDAPVISTWMSNVQAMTRDLRILQRARTTKPTVHKADARDAIHLFAPSSISAVITSPPYPNEKDYTRTTRLESVILGFISNKTDLKALKRNLMRSNTRNVYKGDDDDQWVANNTEIQQLARAIESRRIELGKTSGFERLYGKVTKLYFGGMARHLAELRPALRPGARLAYVVGDQASYLRIMIRTGQLLAGIGQSLGYELETIDLFRTRLATASKEQLREEVVVLRWPGG